jgi:hypothetical protein
VLHRAAPSGASSFVAANIATGLAFPLSGSLGCKNEPTQDYRFLVRSNPILSGSCVVAKTCAILELNYGISRYAFAIAFFDLVD